MEAFFDLSYTVLYGTSGVYNIKGTSHILLRKLQSVQNATARLITGTRRSDHILAGITRTPLATHPTARQVQSGMTGSPVAVRTGASLLGRRLPSRVRQHSALSVVS